MKIKMKTDKIATANQYGSATMTYAKDSVHDMSSEWQMKLATKLVNSGQAESVAKETTKAANTVAKETTKAADTVSNAGSKAADTITKPFKKIKKPKWL